MSRRRPEPLHPCPYCGMPIYVPRDRRDLPTCHTCDLFVRWER